MEGRIPQSTSYNTPDDANQSQMSDDDSMGTEPGGSTKMQCPSCGANLEVSVGDEQDSPAAGAMPMMGGAGGKMSPSSLAGKL